MTPQDRIERSKDRAASYRAAALALKQPRKCTASEHKADEFVAGELMKKYKFYTEQAETMERFLNSEKKEA